VRDHIAQGKRSPACSACWKLEDSGLNSERILHNRAMDFYQDRDIEKIQEDALSYGYQPQLIKLATSNLCNSTCVTCDSGSSSAWAALESKPIQYRIMSQDRLQGIDLSQIVQLSFVGGEPLLEKANFDILQRLIDVGNTHCFISVVTNGSCNLSKSMLEILGQFKNLNICVSIDGTGSVFEYMRYPLQWDKLLDNIALFKQIARYVSVSSMISNLNIFYYSEIIDFFLEHELTYLFKHIEQPSIFSPGNLPDAAKQLVLDRNPRYVDHVKGFLTCGSYSPEQWGLLKKEIHRQDQLKGIDIQKYLPDLSNYMNL
jgi:sulfatase maturation enzyme AslB (radical SAM superfamily)